MNKFGEKVLSMFRRGMPQRVIARKLNRGIGTIAYWTHKYGDLNKAQLSTLELARAERQRLARGKGSKRIKEKWESVRKAVASEAACEFKSFKKEPFFMLGLGLYLGEGDKARKDGRSASVAMVNLDLFVLKIFVRWCREYLKATQFSAFMQTFSRRSYKAFCREVDSVIGEKFQWSNAPTRPLNKYSLTVYPREYGTVKVYAKGLKMASCKVNAWIDLLKSMVAMV